MQQPEWGDGKPLDGSTGDVELEVELEAAAKLSAVEYERQRKEIARRLGIRASALDVEVKKRRPPEEGEESDLGLVEPEPWPEAVDGEQLLADLVGAISRYVAAPKHVAETAALWTVHTHCFENWRHTPRLAITSPAKGSGKSTLLDVISYLVLRPLKTENLSMPVMFRVIEEWSPTLLIDEVDTFLRDNEDLRGCLNAGHAKGGRHLRCEGDDNRVRAFKTFAPVATSGIGGLPGTLADRSIRVTMLRRRPDEVVENFRDDHDGRLHVLAQKAARWVRDNETNLREHDPAMPGGVMNRKADNWRPLFAIADLVGGEWPQLARHAATSGTADQDETSYPLMLLEDVRKILDRHVDRNIASDDLADQLADFEDRPWPEYGRARKPISPAQIARLLKDYGISPGTVRLSVGTRKGYKRESFNEAFARYLPSQSVTPSQSTDTNGFSDFQNVTSEFDVTFRNHEKPKDSTGCDGVTAGKGGMREGGKILERQRPPSQSWSVEVDI